MAQHSTKQVLCSWILCCPFKVRENITSTFASSQKSDILSLVCRMSPLCALALKVSVRKQELNHIKFFLWREPYFGYSWQPQQISQMHLFFFFRCGQASHEGSTRMSALALFTGLCSCFVYCFDLTSQTRSTQGKPVCDTCQQTLFQEYYSNFECVRDLRSIEVLWNQQCVHCIWSRHCVSLLRGTSDCLGWGNVNILTKHCHALM